MEHLEKNKAEGNRTKTMPPVLTVASNVIRPDMPRVQVSYDEKGHPVFLDPNASLNNQLNTRFGPHWAKESAGIASNFILTSAATFVPDGAAILPFISNQAGRLVIAGAAVTTKIGLKAGGAYAQEVLTDGKEASLAGYGKQFAKAAVVPSNWGPISGTVMGNVSINLHQYKARLSSVQPKYGEKNLTNLFGTKFATGFGKNSNFFPDEIQGSTTPLALGYTFEKKLVGYGIFGAGHHEEHEEHELTSMDLIESSPYRKVLTPKQLKEIYETEEYYKWNESLYHPKDIKGVVDLFTRRPFTGTKRVLLDETITPWSETLIEESNDHIKEIVKNSAPKELFQANPYGMGPANMAQAQLQTETLIKAGAYIINTLSHTVSGTMGVVEKLGNRIMGIGGLIVQKFQYYNDVAEARREPFVKQHNEAIRKYTEKQKLRDEAEERSRRVAAIRLATISATINTKVVLWRGPDGKMREQRITINASESTSLGVPSRSELEKKANLNRNRITQAVTGPVNQITERNNPFKVTGWMRN